MDRPPRPRRWWKRLPARLSLRVLMIVVLVLGGGLGWVVHSARVQRDAVAAIERAGGSVVYDYGWTDGRRSFPATASRWPKWLLDKLGPDYFHHVAAVYLDESVNGKRNKFDDALMAHVGRLRQLDFLSLNGCKFVTDAGLAQLRGLTELSYLDLSYTGATGAGLRNLAGMTRLKRLELPYGPIADADLAHLKGLTSLEWLQGGQTPGITDNGLAHLEGMRNLKVLSLHSPRITSAGLVALRDIKSLEILSLHHCGVTDLTPIRRLPKLMSLDLAHTPIDDAGLTCVGDLKDLSELRLIDTKVTDAGLAHVGASKGLTHLDLGDTRITDDGLAHLAGLNKLVLLFLQRTRVTDAGLARLAGLKALEQVAVSGKVVTDAGLLAAQKRRLKTRFVRME